MDYLDFRYQNTEETFTVYCKKWTKKVQSRHFHNFYEILYMIRGERHFFINDRTYAVKSGNLIMIHPNTLHRGIDPEAEGCEFIVVYFDPVFAFGEKILATGNNMKNGQKKSPMVFSHELPLSPLFSQKDGFLCFTDHEKTYYNLLTAILSEAYHQNTGFELFIHARLLELLISMCRQMEKDHIAALQEPGSMHQKISEIITFINGHYMENLSLSYLSRQFHISGSYLSRIFKEITSFSFVEYLNHIRIKEAKRLLLKTDMKVSGIAEKAGFGSITHFERVFKEVSGQTPLSYRKNFVR